MTAYSASVSAAPVAAPSTFGGQSRSISSIGNTQPELGLLNLLGLLTSRPWWLLIASLVGTLLGGLYYLYQIPVYKTAALVQVESREKSLGAALGNMGALLNNEGQSGSGSNAELEVVASRMVLEPVIEARQLNLHIVPRMTPVIGPILGRIAEGNRFRRDGFGTFEANGLKLDIGSMTVEAQDYGRPFLLVALGRGTYRLEEHDSVILGTGHVGARLAWPGGQLFVRDLVAPVGQVFRVSILDPLIAYENLRSHITIAEQGRQSGVISLSLEDADPRHGASVLNDIVDAYLRQNVERKSAEAQKTLEFLEGELPKLKDRLTTAEGAFNAFRLQNQSADLTKETDIVLQQSADLESQLLTLQQKRDELVRRFEPAHPAVQALDEQIARIRGAIGGQNTAIRRLPQVQQDLLRLKRDVDVTNGLYLSLLNNAQELRIARAGTVGNVRVIDSALPRFQPVRPSRNADVAGGLLLGLVLGALASLVRALTNKGLVDPAEIEQITGQPVVASIPYSDLQRRLFRRAERGARLLAVADPSALSVESLRSLRTSLHFLMLDAANNRIMLTGPSPSLGKSFVSLNLGAVVAQTGQKVVVIDADLRRGRLQEYLGVSREAGVSEYVASHNDLKTVIKNSPQAGLDIITTGKLPPNPAELLLHPRFARLLEECSQKYDIVIVDSPPVLAVADPMIISQQTDTVLMVLKYAQHPSREIDQALQRLEQVGSRLRGIIVNQVRQNRTTYGNNAYVYQYAYTKKAKD